MRYLMSAHWEDALSLFSLPIKAEDVALQYYMASYAPNAVFAYLPKFWSTFSRNSQSTLAISTSALACWAREFRRPDLMRLARQQYTKTLVRTNKALSDPKLAVLDSTLLSCLLLSTFEALSFSGCKTPHNWMAHVRGCSTILYLRGKKQLHYELGRELFNHASTIIRTYCSLYSAPLPVGLTCLQRHAAEILDRSSPMARMGPLLDRFAALRAALKGMVATDVVREALYLDGECLILLEETNHAAPYEIRHADEYLLQPPLQTYRGIIHEYTDQGVARWCNVLRMIRLTLNEWIFCAFEAGCGIVIDEPAPDDPLKEEWTMLQARVIRNGEEIISSVLASVPYSFDLLKESIHSPSTPARFLIWPLAAVGTCELCPPSAKAFAINRLEALGKVRGLEQAALAAQMLTAGDPLGNW